MMREEKTVCRIGPYEIRRWLSHEAYARNGNHHNPTKYYNYQVYRDGMPVSSPMPYLRDAKEFAKELNEPISGEENGWRYPTKG